MSLFWLANLLPFVIGSGRLRIRRGFPFRHSEVLFAYSDRHRRHFTMPGFDDLNYTACLKNLLCSVIFAVIVVAVTRGVRSLIEAQRRH